MENGAMDAMVYVRFHVCTANMTGNTIVLGVNFGAKHAVNARDAGSALAACRVYRRGCGGDGIASTSNAVRT
jgi:uncharacterized membrane protein YoaK (UPF0700 family)